MLKLLGESIRLARQQRHLTQERLAQLAGVSRWQLALLEKGNNVSVAFLLKVAAALELSEVPAEFLTIRQAAPETRALILAADAIAVARNLARQFTRASRDLERSARSIDGLLHRKPLPAAARRLIAEAAERLADTPPEPGEEGGRAPRAVSAPAGPGSRPARPKEAAAPAARKRSR
jgi:transcriptional regulator with XRE-family HTH domain